MVCYLFSAYRKHSGNQSSLGELCFNLSLETFRFCGGCKTLYGLSVARNEELGEIPEYVVFFLVRLAYLFKHCVGCLCFETLVFFCGCLGLEERKNRVFVITIHVGFLHYLEGDTIVDTAEGLDLAVGTRILFGKLVAGESDNDETLVAIFFVEFFESIELWSEATLGSSVDDEENLTAKIVEIYLFSI